MAIKNLRIMDLILIVRGAIQDIHIAEKVKSHSLFAAAKIS